MLLFKVERVITSALALKQKSPCLAYTFASNEDGGYPTPPPPQDAITVYRYLLDQGISPQQIGFFSDNSAGGNLVIALL